MSKFNWKENIEDSIKVGLIITPPPSPTLHWNIFHAKGSKCKTTKGTPGCYGYHEIWR